jgi:nucleoid-associated protein YgaU
MSDVQRSRLLACLLALGCLSWVGCQGDPASGNREDRDPLIRRARAAQAAHDYEGAVALYQRALDRSSDLAQAHLEIGQVYDQHKSDKLRAIYHYQRFLELRPTSEKSDLVRELIRSANLSYASTLPTKPSEAVREIELLKREVATLRALLADKPPVAPPAASAAARPAPTVAPPPTPAPVPVPVVAAVPPQAEYYVVRPGDTLSRIATRVYNDASKWDVIFDANRQTLPTQNSLKVGQRLLIPRH